MATLSESDGLTHKPNPILAFAALRRAALSPERRFPSQASLRSLCNNQKRRTDASRPIQPMTNSLTPMHDSQHSHTPHFLTQPIEELTPDNDPESWASFQRALSKWKAKCASQDAARSSSLQSGMPKEGNEATERLERSA